MSLADFTPTVDQLRRLALAELLAEVRWPDCHRYALILASAADRARHGSDDSWKALGLLAFVLGLNLNPDDDHQPFRTHLWFGEMGPDNLSDAQYAVLEAWLPDVPDAEIAARLADLLWIRRRGGAAHLHGRLAVSKYVASAQRLAAADRKQWPFTVDRLRRATTLARKFQLVDEVKTLVFDLLRSRGAAKPGMMDASLMELMLELGVGDPSEWLPLARSLAEIAEPELRTGTWGRPGPTLAKHLWGVAAKWRARQAADADDPEVRQLQLRAAEMSLIEADHAREAGQPMAEAHRLNEVVREFRKLGVADRVPELVSRIKDAHQRIPTTAFKSEVDVSDEADKGRTAVSGKSLQDAIRALAFVVTIPRKAVLQDMALNHLRGSIASKIAATVVLSHDARVVAHKPTMKGKEPDDTQDAALIEWQMRESAPWLRMLAISYIEGARQQLLLEHSVRLRDLRPLVSQSCLVPEGHEELFARGFLAGFQDDFICACHILIPQLENGLRVFVERAFGKTLITHKDDGTQMAGLLGRILAVPELESVLGEDLLFDLRALLIEQDSVNLRNNLSHGLLPDAGFGVEAIYAWWLCLRIAFLLITPSRGNRATETDEVDSELAPG
jgi:hypothetical protein